MHNSSWHVRHIIKALIALNWFGATWALTLNISNAFDKVKYAGYFQKLKSYGISGQIFGLISYFSVIMIDSFKWFWMASLHKNIQLILYFLKAPFLVLHLSYYTLMTFLMMLSVILLSMLMILLYSKCDQASDLWQQLELASELESDLWDTLD